MTIKRVVPRELANRDVDEAIDHYLSEGSAESAMRFIKALERAYRQIGRHPENDYTFMLAGYYSVLGRLDLLLLLGGGCVDRCTVVSGGAGCDFPRVPALPQRCRDRLEGFGR